MMATAKVLRQPVNWGNLRRLSPISSVFGFDRGLPIDRYYIQKFLEINRIDIKGRVLEIGDSYYTSKYGGNKVTHSDVLHATADSPDCTIISDLTRADNIDSDTFDCVILTQTLPFIYDLRSALSHLGRILKPGGVVLATLPGISQISRYDMDRWGDYWRFTTLSAQRLFGEVFPSENLSVESFGNVLVATAFLQGIAAEELQRDELDHLDPDYQLIITVRGEKLKK